MFLTNPRAGTHSVARYEGLGSVTCLAFGDIYNDGA
jgi:hypothetical protein